MMEPEVLRHYEEGIEFQRLARGAGLLELARTQDILARLLEGIRAVEEERSLLGASAHFVTVGRRPR